MESEHEHEWRTIARTGCIRCGKSKPEVSLEQQLAQAQHKVAQVVALEQEVAELRVQVRTFIPQLLQENAQARALLARVIATQNTGHRLETFQTIRAFLAREEGE